MRQFRRTGFCGAAGMALVAFSAAAFAAEQRITPHVTVVSGAVNGVLVSRNGKTLAVYGDPRPKPAGAAMVLFTHHRRDVAWAGRRLSEAGAEPVVPAAEMRLFADTARFWEEYRLGRFRDLGMQSSRILTEPLPRARGVRGGERVSWQGLELEVIDTPGYTRGSVSYLFEIDGKRIACTGDLIYSGGRMLDLYSLQDAIPEVKEDAYHGYGARAADVIASLGRIESGNPDVLIPARGPVIRNPRQEIAALKSRIQAVFASHFAVDALRWYRGDANLRAQARRVLGDRGVDWMPRAETAGLPAWILAIDNSRLILSESGAAYLVDCGSRRILDRVLKLQQEGRLRAVEGIYVTHYHSDHTGSVAAAAEAFRCPVYACGEMKDILERPEAYAMPVETPNAIRRVTATGEGQIQRWHEFEFTYSHYPGQTWYHGGLLVKKDSGETVFFSGDSFTPTGMDDYCLLNRNFAAPGKGYTQCIDRLGRTGGWVVNQHVEPMFRFTPGQVDLMRRNFAERAKLFQALFPWDGANYGLDEQWARFYPYSAEAKAGQPLDLRFVILNHSPAARRFLVTPRAPRGWTASGPVTLPLAPQAEGEVKLRVTPPAGARGVGVVTADVSFAGWDLREWAEAIVAVGP